MYFDRLSFQYTNIICPRENPKKKKDLIYAFNILFLDKFQAFEENLYRM